MENEEMIIKSLNKPLIQDIIITRNHSLFVKFTNQRYFKYAFELLDTLVKKSNFGSKNGIFYSSLYYLIKILYNSGNNIYISNFDLMILCCFSLGIKTCEFQKNMISLTKLKNIYSEKYSFYNNDEIKKVELICISLMNYEINFLTIYDCLYYLLKKNIKLLDEATQLLKEKLKNSSIREIISKKPMDLAHEITEPLINKLKINNNLILVNKKIQLPHLEINKINQNFKNRIKAEESISTSGSNGSGHNSRFSTNSSPYNSKSGSKGNSPAITLIYKKNLTNNYGIKINKRNTISPFRHYMKVNLNNTVTGGINTNKNECCREEKFEYGICSRGKINRKINLNKVINESFSKGNVLLYGSNSNKSSKKIDFSLDTFVKIKKINFQNNSSIFGNFGRNSVTKINSNPVNITVNKKKYIKLDEKNIVSCDFSFNREKSKN